jgi:hypothetical protein
LSRRRRPLFEAIRDNLASTLAISPSAAKNRSVATKILRCAQNDKVALLPGNSTAAFSPPELTALATGL